MNLNLTLSIRHLWRQKVHTLVILLSLVLSFLCTTVLVSVLVAEWKTDSFHANRSHTYQLFSNDPFGGEGNISYIPAHVGPFLLQNYFEIETLCRINANDGIKIKKGTDTFSELTIISADPTFFDIFSFKLIEGSYELSPEGIYLNEREARRMFGNGSAIGETLMVQTADTTRLLTVAGVIATGTEQSHLRFDALVHSAGLGKAAQGGVCYVMMPPGTILSNVEEKINSNPSRPGLIGEGNMNYSFKPLSKSYFSPENRFPYMQTRSSAFINITLVVAILIFFMGGFNFGVLFLLASRERSRETGIRKTLGIPFRRVVNASIHEVLIYLAISLPIAFALAFVSLPFVNNLLGTSVDTNYLWRTDVLLVLGFMILILAVTIALLTARARWRSKPVTLMKATAERSFRSPLFYVQFIISITLIICSLTIVKQIQFVRDAPLGFNRHIIQLHASQGFDSADLRVFKGEVLALPGVRSATISSGNPISGNMMVRYEIGDGKVYSPFIFNGDEDFIRTLNLTVLNGGLSSEGKLVNEAFVKYFGLKDPIGQLVPGTSDRISGVVKDFTCGSFKNHIPPVIISLNDQGSRLLLDYAGGNPYKLMSTISALGQRIYTDINFEFNIIEEDLMNKYQEDLFFYKVLIAASVLSILISFFGLFAICWSTTQARIKEIGIRKVLGATVLNIVELLTVAFFRKIGVAFLVAAPIGYYFSQRWLETFAKRIDFSFSILVYAACVVILVTIVTLAVQITRAALANPVDELRRE